MKARKKRMTKKEFLNSWAAKNLSCVYTGEKTDVESHIVPKKRKKKSFDNMVLVKKKTGA